MFAAVLAVCGTVIAGTQYRNENQIIYGQGGSLGGEILYASEYCQELPDGMGGTIVYGKRIIFGYIAGNHVDEYVDFNGLSSCPGNGNGNSNSNDDNYSISVNGLRVDANCTGQVTSKGSGNGQTKRPGQKPQNYTNHWTQSWTPNSFGNACVITGTDASGNTETYGTNAQASDYNSFQNYNQ